MTRRISSSKEDTCTFYFKRRDKGYDYTIHMYSIYSYVQRVFSCCKLVHLEDPTSIKFKDIKIENRYSTVADCKWLYDCMTDYMTNDRRHGSVPYHVSLKVSIACRAILRQIGDLNLISQPSPCIHRTPNTSPFWGMVLRLFRNQSNISSFTSLKNC